MNALLCHIRQTLFEITESLISGPDGLPMHHIQAARSIAQEHVPLSWNHPNLQPNTHTLFSWLEGSLFTAARNILFLLFDDGATELCT